jgi:hypothetical protein
VSSQLSSVRIGLALVLAGLVFGIGMGVGFGVNEDAFKDYISQGIADHPAIHDAKSQDKIWRYAQRAHFHATGIAAFSIGLILLVAHSTLSSKSKQRASILVGLGGLYPLAWLSMFILSPSLGRGAAHSHIATEFFTYVGVGSLVLGLLVLVANLYLGWFSESNDA